MPAIKESMVHMPSRQKYEEIRRNGRISGSKCTQARRKRKLLATTLTELKAIAAAAKLGESESPKAGIRTPAASGIRQRL